MKQLILILLLFAAIGAKAQPQEQEPLRDRIYVGGNVGFQFGTDYTSVLVAPLVGYKFTEKFSAGIGGTYMYYKIKDRYYNYTFSTNIYGGSLFTRYFLFENLFAHAEYEMLNLKTFNFFEQKTERLWVPALFIGGGYQQMLGSSSFAQILLLYDIIQETNTPYQSPLVVRVGFGFGF